MVMYHGQMRHPNILAFKDTVEVEERGESVIYLVTEAVKPLLHVISELNLEGTQRCDMPPIVGATHAHRTS
jgi:SCY1-like protein 1